MTAHCRIFRVLVVSRRSRRRDDGCPQRRQPSRSNSPIRNMSRSNGPTSTAGPATTMPRRLRLFSRAAARSTANRRPAGDVTAIADALKDVCERARAAIPLDDDGARKFFEDNFRPLHINRLGDTDGFLTGYYEPIIDGSRVPTGEFTAPLYRRPPNLVVAGRRKLGDVFPSKGVKVGRRVGRRKIVPYYDRGEIEDGALDGWHLEICWLRDPVDVLFAQIQGSARIRLEDGTILRVNYDSHNGWPYTPVGRVLIDRKAI